MKLWRHRDGGFTLAELLVATVLLAVILAITYTALQVVYKGRDVSDKQASFADEVAQPLAMLEKTSSQAITVICPSGYLGAEADFPYKVSFLTDKDNDDVLERNDVEATADGRLIQDVWLTNYQGAYTTHVMTYLLSTRNVNRAAGIPLVTYRTAEPSSTVITTIGASTRAKNLVITVAAQVEGETLQDSRSVFMRNR